MYTLITGASGFLGSNLLEYYENVIPIYLNKEIKNGIKCDLKDREHVNSIFSKYKIERVIHCAANSIPKHPSDISSVLNTHLLATINLLENSKDIKFTYISSIMVYDYLESFYGACKASAEIFCRSYDLKHNLDLKIIRPCAIVGKNTTHGLLADLRKKVHNDSEYLELNGVEPGTLRPYVHIDDVINYIRDSDDREYDIGIFNVMNIDQLSSKEVAEIYMEQVGIKKEIKFSGTSYTGDLQQLNFPHTTNNLKYNSSKKAIIAAI